MDFRKLLCHPNVEHGGLVGFLNAHDPDWWVHVPEAPVYAGGMLYRKVLLGVTIHGRCSATEWQIYRVVISPHRRRCGLARDFVQAIVSQVIAPEVVAEIEGPNVAGQDLFRQCGFKCVRYSKPTNRFTFVHKRNGVPE